MNVSRQEAETIWTLARLVGGSNREREEALERDDGIDVVTDYLRDCYRDGASSVRVVIDNIDPVEWKAIEAQHARRFPDGDVKVERVAVGLVVEWVRRPVL